MTYIYLVENCYSDSNKVYIGKTKNPKSRKYNHINTYGKSIIYTIIEQINSTNYKDWEPLESYWIEQFRQWGFILINQNKGGGGPSFLSIESRQKISFKIKNNKERGLKISESNKGKSHSNKGKKLSKDHCIKIKQTRDYLKNRKRNWNLKPVLQYDKQGNFIKEWLSINEAQMYYKPKSDGIGACCRQDQKTAYGFKWNYKLK
jgi:hypothetical protein